ncbi:alpha/beta fold hydrolase [Pseudonocardia humida]|uniref:Alpha/beta fold hydrolase n=1 Tax=Pseudonocardia humida TaxID=2800819 RepID=A0ABT0ZTH5_9PSEU|nr:alpha/beta hydrolase [Pseudonocardia humida]MCO1653984.1 alpha/beta fold hydrolase [Pseudonocardia humida]
MTTSGPAATDRPPLPPGVREGTVVLDRIQLHYLETGPEDGDPVVLVHGNLSTSRFWEHLMPALAERHRVIAPDMRGFGDSQAVPLDATGGLRDWAEDIRTVLEWLDVTRPPHLVGWSTGGAAIAHYAMAHPVASLAFVDPVSPYGYGGTHPDGRPCFDDFAGSGGGGINPAVVEAIEAGDTSADNPFAPRSMFRTFYVAPSYTERPEREDLLVAEILKTSTGPDNYPGDSAASPNWPGFAPGERGILNALSPKYCNWTGILDLDPKPPVLWTHGAADLVIADGSPLEAGVLGAAGQIPGWPGAAVYPQQPMVSQIREVLGRYRAAGGSVRSEMFPESGHAPFLDAADKWLEVYQDFLSRS